MHTNHTPDLVLERLPNGEHALLRPEPEDVRYVLTDAGRRALAMAALFNPGPTVADVIATPGHSSAPLTHDALGEREQSPGQELHQ